MTGDEGTIHTSLGADRSIDDDGDGERAGVCSGAVFDGGLSPTRATRRAVIC